MAVSGNIHVLIVEDVATMRELLQHVVGGIPGVGVSGAVSNTWQARVEMSRRRPHIVLLDEILPGESSLDFLADLKTQDIPTVLLTGMKERDQPAAGFLPPGAFSRIIKPGWKSLDEDRARFEAEIRKALNK